MLLSFLFPFMLLYVTINCVSGQTVCKTGCKCVVGVCNACDDGYYMQNWKCIRCSANCVACSSGETCLRCDAGHHLQKYHNGKNSCSPCSEGCHTCLSEVECLQCDTGYFKYGDSCTKCPVQCKRCQSDNFCLECNVGFPQNGTLCQGCQEGSFEAGGSCSPCPNNCASCSIFNECTKCKPGYFGITCTQKCSRGCTGNVCDQDIGQCTCQHNFVGNACDLCHPGKFGPSCNHDCPKRCITCISSEKCGLCLTGYYGYKCNKNCHNGCWSKICDQITGDCLKCYPYFKSPDCIKCVDGKWGRNCSNECPDSCLTCNSFTECTKCINGYHGENCEMKCSGGCLLELCEQSTGICSRGCKENFTGQQCDRCKTGQYGYNCSLLCPKDCYGPACNRIDGTCTTGCNPKFYGAQCNVACSANCKTCTSAIVCQSCEDGLWGDRCTRECPANCLDNTCQTDGNCSACISGYYGDNCNINCPNNCIDHSCNMSGYCYDCQPGYFDMFCSEHCPTNCLSGRCMRNGSCVSCLSGFYGARCDRNCPENCQSCTNYTSCQSCMNGFYRHTCRDICSFCRTGTTCNIDTGNCEFCEEGLYGNKCRSKCDTKCQTCDSSSSSIGECLTCKVGSYGRYESSRFYHCNMLCSRNCINATCNAEFGTCYYGCKRGYWGDRCLLQCPSNCLHSDCHSDNGTCRQGCLDGYNGDKCDCPVNCICFSDGTCATCKAGFGNLDKNCTCTSVVCNNENNCTSCMNSTFYLQSNSCCECNRNCRENECYSEFQCRYGCKAGFYGSSCLYECKSEDEKCTDCITKTDGKYGGCISCIQGYYPDLDSTTANMHCIECTKTCLDEKCDEKTGVCLMGCVNGTWGERCDNRCFASCLMCHQITGKCNVCLNNTVQGSNCDQECNNNCVGQVCDRSTGKCSFGCEVGFYGERCHNLCSDNCRNNTCDRETGSCDNGCLEGFKGVMCSHENTVDNTSSTTKQLGTIILLVSVLMLVISIVVVIVILGIKRKKPKQERLVSGSFGEVVTYGEVRNACKRWENNSLGPLFAKRYNNKKRQRLSGSKKRSVACLESAEPNADNHPKHCLSEGTTEYAKFERKRTVLQDVEIMEECEFDETLDDHIYFNAEEVMKRRIPLDKLKDFVRNKTTNNYVKEFEEFPAGLIKPYKESQKKENLLKNRYRDIYPYDSRRVILREGTSDYINASYIDGYKKHKAYIASMGPTIQHMGADFAVFWNMIWQERVSKIVMLTNLRESGVQKCDKYWPDKGYGNKYGDVKVKCQFEENFANYTARIFTMEKTENRTLHHMHFTAWPDKSTPENISSLTEFWESVSALSTIEDGPMLVHCSAGVGRTGTFIALDILAKEGISDGHVDIFACVRNLREERVSLVQTVGQYRFLHEALVQILSPDNTHE